MPIIMPIKELRKTSEISELAHQKQEPIFITKNGYSDLVVMSSELYDKLVETRRIDRAIDESEREVSLGAIPMVAEDVFSALEGEHFG